MEVKKKFSLKAFNTFGIDAKASSFVEINHISELSLIFSSLTQSNSPILILGGGSNILFTKDFPGLVIKNNLKGIEISKEDNDSVWIKAASGENWHDLVLFSINQGLGGIENLSLIPGTVGASPIQNIGAYGVELKDVLEEVIALNIQTQELEKFSNAACKFGYRESIFKKERKDRYFITSIILKLAKKPTIKISYGAIEQILKNKKVEEITVRDVSDAVIAIRQSKLPNPSELGNAGSFFKNPEITIEQFNLLKEEYPTIPHYPTSSPDLIKIPAGWLIEQCGWKGKRKGNAGVHTEQALVIVNYGNASGQEIINLAQEIQNSVKVQFNISLIPEVNIV